LSKRKGVIVYEPTYIHPTVKIGKGTKIGAFVDIGKNVVIGENCSIQAHVTISNRCKIGNNVFIGPNTSILNDKYPICKKLAPPIIHDDVIMGGCVVILPDIIIGERSVIGAGSIITKNVPKESVVYGSPAQYQMSRQEYEQKKVQWEGCLAEDKPNKHSGGC